MKMKFSASIEKSLRIILYLWEKFSLLFVIKINNEKYPCF